MKYFYAYVYSLLYAKDEVYLSGISRSLVPCIKVALFSGLEVGQCPSGSKQPMSLTLNVIILAFSPCGLPPIAASITSHAVMAYGSSPQASMRDAVVTKAAAIARRT